ncbi:putative glycoside hydrolase family 15 protein [Crossiella sp. SN42]|uniref:putative glycoside hydrolase n=1 Tax=Crossiella sp. SN42 TaxID=2944808 RepID=UPI00207C2021|nr:putative glycoside hydrolase [Crossiella sp. SN42]MCO1574340.1 putative glycoside hydrolase family 15 protein [Crossiella sp. SN42]
MLSRRTLLKAGAFALAYPGPALASAHWRTVPVYGHLGKRTDFTAEDISFLVRRYSVITIEKTQGASVRQAAEQASARALNQLKQREPAPKVYYYWNSAVAYPEHYAALADLPPAWTLKQTDGQPWQPIANNADALAYDLSRKDVRDWWVEQAVTQVKRGYDGIFVDGVKRFAMGTTRLAKIVGAEKQQAVTAGIGKLVPALRAALPAGKVLLCNGVEHQPNAWPDSGKSFLTHADATMLEHFGITGPKPNTAAEMAAQLDLLSTVDSQYGKFIAFCGWPDSGRSAPLPLQAGITFPLACFLVAAGAHSYFRYGSGWRAEDGPLEPFPELERPLGPPQGPAVRDGYTYTRTFEHAHVTVDLAAVTGRIAWTQPPR